MDHKFTSLKKLVNDTFTVTSASGYQFKKWDNEARKMLISEDWQEGYDKKYSLETNKGTLDVGPGQLGRLLEVVYQKGEANIIGKTFSVKSNGKTGMEVRYYLALVKNEDGFNKFVEVNNKLKSSQDDPATIEALFEDTSE